MPISIPRLRYWFAMAAIAIVLAVAGFYLYARFRGLYALKNIQQSKLPVEVQQSTQDFSLSKSEGGRTIFTVRAARAMQFKQGGRAELKDVNIVVYGRDANRFDQIYGSDFVYDPQSGNITANGEVHMDLEGNAEGQNRPDQAPPQELKNPIHVLTSGLVFNQKTGNAVTQERVEFRVPHASGWAQGASYDSRQSRLLLERDVHLAFTGPDPATVVAEHGLLTKDPRRAVLYSARIERQNARLDTAELSIFLRDDNSVDRITASGGLRSTAEGATQLAVAAPEAVLYLRGRANEVAFAEITGGVSFAATGANTMSGNANRVRLDFGAHNQLGKVHAQGNVKLIQPPQHATNGPGRQAKTQAALPGAQGQTVELAADAIDFKIANGKRLRRAETAGNAQITLTPQNAPPGERTVATAAKFSAGFSGENKINSLKGSPGARVVSYVPGQSERISTSESIEVGFSARGSVSTIVQQGDFHYAERLPNGTERAAWSQSATYSPETELLTLQGQPRVVEGGMTTTARLMRLNRRSGDASADADVKTTYSELKPQANGALLASSDPIHVTARSMTAQRATGLAHYAGNARLWQGANIVEAPTIDFDREKRMVLAQADKGKRVATVLTQERDGKQTPVSVTAAQLSYVDAQRTVRFEGGAVVRSSDGTLTANHVDVLLKPAGAGGGGMRPNAGSSQVERIVAEGKVDLQQPKRRASGQKLVYTAAEDKYVLTGGPPSIFDAEHGTITGASLTFYNRDDRVLVEGGGDGRVVTHTRVSR